MTTIYKVSMAAALLMALLLVALEPTLAFLPQPTPLRSATTAATPLHMLDPASFADTANTFMSNPSMMTEAAVASSQNLLAFTDQGQNLAGIFFQASLLPYLLFLYFLSFKANRISELGNFGFQFLLLFVLSTIPGGIVSKATYGTSLANVDWLHGGAEALLTVANVLVVRSIGIVPNTVNAVSEKKMALENYGFRVVDEKEEAHNSCHFLKQKTGPWI